MTSELDVTQMMSRFGRSVPVDAVFDAWCSRDVDRMRAALSLQTNDVDRAALLGRLVEALYKRRTEPGVREEMFNVAELHIGEMPRLFSAAQAHRRAEHDMLELHHADRARQRGEPVQPYPAFDADQQYAVDTFVLYVRALCEVEQFEKACDVWRAAQSVGYVDEFGLEAGLEGVEKRRRKNEAAKAKLERR